MQSAHVFFLSDSSLVAELRRQGRRSPTALGGGKVRIEKWPGKVNIPGLVSGDGELVAAGTLSPRVL